MFQKSKFEELIMRKFSRNSLARLLSYYIAAILFVLLINVDCVIAVTTWIEHDPIKYFVPGKSIRIEAKVSDREGIKLVRLYFKTEKQPDYVFLPMNPKPDQFDQYTGILPAPSEAVNEIEYLILAVNKNNEAVKTHAFTVIMDKMKSPPVWQDVPKEGQVKVSRESSDKIVSSLDSTPPVILITSPKVFRGVKLTAKDASITVMGTATDDSGVATVTVNGETAAIDASGNFSAEVLLKVGENRIVVAATDIRKNTAKETFTLVREAGQVAKAKSDATQSAMGIGGGKYYGLIIGNNNYRHLARLQTAVKDATTIEKVLKESYGFESRLLLNATRKDILSAINEFRNKLAERDNLLIYYAGHGEFDRSADKAYWLPVDALRDDPTDWIIADDITSSIKRLSSKHVLIVSDSCYSGTLSRGAQTSLINKGERDEFLKKMTSRPSRTLMASGGNEPVADGGGSGHSIFADSFLKALSEIENSVFTADELFYQNIRSRVAGRSDQVPEYSEIRNSGHDGGDFVFFKIK